MRTELRLSFGAGLFLGIVALIYWFWSREQTGTTCLVFGFCAYALIGGYLVLQWWRRKGIPRPEDRDDADQADGAGEIGFFPAASIWPPGMGVGAVLIAVGFVYGVWWWVLGAIFLFGSIAGYVVESDAREEGPDDPGMPVDPAGHGSSTPVTSEHVPSPYQQHG